ncbi:Protein SOSEKI 1 [Exophiala dermatitidis]|nr:Protein SOSEKI 1 [Exophiala dermatitidis]KAJ4535867.1 Protein SOSEKI 1 [Exophiala dermatitidis]
METDQEDPAGAPGEVRGDSITELSSPSDSPAMKSSSCPRVDLPSARAGPAENDVDIPCKPSSVPHTICDQDPQLSFQCVDVQSGGGTEYHNLPYNHFSRSIPVPPCTSIPEQHALVNAMADPPVTTRYLEEIDIARLSENVVLRNEINYDPNPRFSFEERDRKEYVRGKSREYWLSLKAELKILYQHGWPPSCADCQAICSPARPTPRHFESRLPNMFTNLKELLDDSLPEAEKDQLAQYLDVPFLLQELSHGLMDVARFADWVSRLLMSHCAPFRDAHAQFMSRKIREGAENRDFQVLVEGIESLFELLKLMKLDSAHYQVNRLRGALIDDTVNFQQHVFRERLEGAWLDGREHWGWLQGHAVNHHARCSIAGRRLNDLPYVSLIHGLVDTCFGGNRIPDTLAYDAVRLQRLGAQMHELTCLEVCLDVFEGLVRKLNQWRSNLGHMLPGLRMRLLILTDGVSSLEVSKIQQWWEHREEAIAGELTRAAFEVCGKPLDSISHADTADTAHLLAAALQREWTEHEIGIKLCRTLEEHAFFYVQQYRELSPMSIFMAQQRMRRLYPQPQGYRLPDIALMASLLGHISVIHWRVFADLIYLHRNYGKEPSDEGGSTDEYYTSPDDTVMDGDPGSNDPSAAENERPLIETPP